MSTARLRLRLRKDADGVFLDRVVQAADFAQVEQGVAERDLVKSDGHVLVQRRGRAFEEDIHSDLAQDDREKLLRRFKNRELKVLIATDILSRGIDVENIDMVINFDLPHDADDYIHRIGRTARAEESGVAITFISQKEQHKFAAIEKILEKPVYKGIVPVQFGEAPSNNPSQQNRGRGRKIISILFLFLLQTLLYSQGIWERTDVPTNKFLRSVAFTDSLNGWAAGDSGTIIHTNDGGKTWNLQDSKTQNEIRAIFFLNRNLGWASSLNYTIHPFGTVLLKTTDGGTSWNAESFPDSNVFINCIWFRDSLDGWMGGSPNALVKTINGGIGWTQAATDSSTLALFPVLSIKFFDEKYGYACGGMHDIAGVIWRTSNGGDLWYAIDPSEAPADEVYELHLFDSLNVLGAGGDPDFSFGVGMIRTTDGGLHWDYKEIGYQGNAFDLDFRNDREAWAPLGPQQKFIFSKDAGFTWSVIPTPDSTAIYNMTFPDSLHGFAVGREGAVLKFKPPVIGSINPDPAINQDGFILYQNSPNPFSSVTRIKFFVPSGGVASRYPIQLRVYDVLGIEVARLVNKILLPGEFEVTFDGTGLLEGIYFYKLSIPGNAGSLTSNRRMILIKK